MKFLYPRSKKERTKECPSSFFSQETKAKKKSLCSSIYAPYVFSFIYISEHISQKLRTQKSICLKRSEFFEKSLMKCLEFQDICFMGEQFFLSVFFPSPSITDLQGQCEKSTRTKNAWRHRSRNVEIPQVKCSDRV